MKKLILGSVILFLISTIHVIAQTITTGTPFPGSPYCAGANLIVPYTASGGFAGGNIFTAQLSDGVGSFASPVTIGSVVSTGSGNINCVIPAGTATGSTYAVRVVSTTPAITGSTYPIGSINALPIVNYSVSPNDTVCFGASVTFFGTGAFSYSWSGSVVDGAPFTPTVGSSNYTVTGTGAAGCTNTTSAMITVNPLPTLGYIALPNDTVCYGTVETLSGTGANSYLWSGGVSDGVPFTATATNTYTLTGTDANSCISSMNVTLHVNPSTDISGNITYSGGIDTSGLVLLYPYQSVYTHFDTLQIDTLNSSGNYSFANIAQGDYLVKVFPDTLAYPTLATTYFGDEWEWDTATIIHHGCAVTDIADVSMIEMTGVGGGIGLLHGVIIEGNGYGRAPGGPINGVDVKLGLTGSSTIVASTESDTSGNYTFANVDFGNYTIYVDIAGLERVTLYTLTLDIVNFEYLCLDHIVDSVEINTQSCSSTAGINDNSTDQNKFNVYPNPVRISEGLNSTIQYSINTDANVTLDIYNMMGAKVQSLLSDQQHSGEYQFKFNPKGMNLKAGLYFVSLSVNGKTSTKRIVVME